MYIQPPPQRIEELKAVPDYFCGRLIYETDDGDSCRWVVYDSNEKHRFPSRSAAEKWCVNHSHQVNNEDIGNIMLTIARLTSSYKTLDDLANVMTEDGTILQAIALTIRQCADKLDTITAKYVQDRH